MARVYQKLRLNRVDFVDKGANPGAHITLAKRAESEGRHMADNKDALPEDVAKRLSEAEAANIELTKRLEAAETQAKQDRETAKQNAETVAKMLEDRARESALTVAKGLKVGTDEAKLADVLFTAKRKLDGAEYDALVGVLKGASEQIAKGKLFGVVGADDRGESGGTELDKLVTKRMAEKGEDKGTAMLAVMQSAEGKAAWAVVRNGGN